MRKGIGHAWQLFLNQPSDLRLMNALGNRPEEGNGNGFDVKGINLAKYLPYFFFGYWRYYFTLG